MGSSTISPVCQSWRSPSSLWKDSLHMNIEVCSMPTNRGNQVTMVTLEWTQKRAHSTSEVQLWPWPKKLTPAQSSASEVTVWDSLGIMMSVLSAKLHPTEHLGIEPTDAFLDSSTNTTRLIHSLLKALCLKRRCKAHLEEEDRKENQRWLPTLGSSERDRDKEGSGQNPSSVNVSRA